MSFTNKTENYNLPQWLPDDKPTFLEDMNGAYREIDTQMKANADAASSAALQAQTASSAASAAVESAHQNAEGLVSVNNKISSIESQLSNMEIDIISIPAADMQWSTTDEVLSLSQVLLYVFNNTIFQIRGEILVRGTALTTDPILQLNQIPNNLVLGTMLSMSTYTEYVTDAENRTYSARLNYTLNQGTITIRIQSTNMKPTNTTSTLILLL